MTHGVMVFISYLINGFKLFLKSGVGDHFYKITKKDKRRSLSVHAMYGIKYHYDQSSMPYLLRTVALIP